MFIIAISRTSIFKSNLIIIEFSLRENAQNFRRLTKPIKNIISDSNIAKTLITIRRRNNCINRLGFSATRLPSDNRVRERFVLNLCCLNIDSQHLLDFWLSFQIFNLTRAKTKLRSHIKSFLLHFLNILYHFI